MVYHTDSTDEIEHKLLADLVGVVMYDLSNVHIWVLMGLIFIGIEIVSGTIVTLMVGMACFVTAIFAHFEIVESWQSQLFLASILSVLSLFVGRNNLKTVWRKKGESSFKNDEGGSLELSCDLKSLGSCEVLYQGTSWTAVNESHHDFKAGEKVRIVRSDGIKLIVSKL